MAEPIMNVQRIMELLPHRPPFLLVDRVVELEAGKRVVGVKGVTMNEPFFVGHFPGGAGHAGRAHPGGPGAVLGADGAGRHAGRGAGGQDHLLHVHRRREVPQAGGAGRPARASLRDDPEQGLPLKTRGEAKVAGAVVAEADFMAMLADAKR